MLAKAMLLLTTAVVAIIGEQRARKTVYCGNIFENMNDWNSDEEEDGTRARSVSIVVRVPIWTTMQ